MNILVFIVVFMVVLMYVGDFCMKLFFDDNVSVIDYKFFFLIENLDFLVRSILKL